MRSFILLAVLILMMSFVLVAVSIRTSAVNEVEAIKNTIGSNFRIEMNFDLPREKLAISIDNPDGTVTRKVIAPLLSDADLEQIQALDGIKGCYSELQGWTLYADLQLTPGFYSTLLHDDEHFEYLEEYGEDIVQEKDQL